MMLNHIFFQFEIGKKIKIKPPKPHVCTKWGGLCWFWKGIAPEREITSWSLRSSLYNQLGKETQKNKQKAPRFLYHTWTRPWTPLAAQPCPGARSSSFPTPPPLLKRHPPLYKMIYWDFKAVAIACGTGCTQLIMWCLNDRVQEKLGRRKSFF